MKKISLRRLEKWKNKKDTKNLLYALKVGTWDTRIKASEFLTEFNDLAIKEPLFLGLLDSVAKVVENIKIALQNFNLSEEENEKIDLIIKSKYDKEKEKLLNELIAISKIKDKERPIEVKKTEIKSEIKKPIPKVSLKKEKTEPKQLIEVTEKEQKEWFYRKRKEQVGPITFDDLKNLIKTGQISFSDYVWTTGIKEWHKVNEVKGLSDIVNIENLPPVFIKEEHQIIKKLKESISKAKLLFSKSIEYIKHKAKKTVNKKVKRIGIPIAILILLSSFTLFYNIKVKDGTTSTCYSCHGSGIHGDNCPVCGGDGKTTSSYTCSRCKGRGTERCYWKATYSNKGFFGIGAGSETYYCNAGRKRAETYDIYGYNGEACPSCGGSGRVDCSTCNGYGKVNKTKTCNNCRGGLVNIRDCETCNKSGVIPNYREYTLFSEYIKPFYNENIANLFGDKEEVKLVKPKVNGKFPEASTRLLTSSDLENLSKKDLKIMRNEIFARHGHIYKSGKLGKYFKAQKWYKGTVKNASWFLTEIEKKNIQLILKYEK